MEDPPVVIFLRKGGGIFLEKRMTPAQRNVYLAIDEWWKRFGFGPSVDDVLKMTGEKGRGNVARKMRALVDLGYCKGGSGPRSIRPAYMRVRDII